MAAGESQLRKKKKKNNRKLTLSLWRQLSA
jgi:hypothetical protein